MTVLIRKHLIVFFNSQPVFLFQVELSKFSFNSLDVGVPPFLDVGPVLFRIPTSPFPEGCRRTRHLGPEAPLLHSVGGGPGPLENIGHVRPDTEVGERHLGVDHLAVFGVRLAAGAGVQGTGSLD